jgi:hypothetical protein
MMLGVVSIEHVLANGGDLRSIAAYRGANVLYDALAAQYHLIGFTMASEEIARWWLKRERMPRWARIMAADLLANDMTSMEYRDWRIMQIRTFLAEGWEIAFYLDCKFGPIEQVHELGVTTITYEHATINPGWRDPALASPRAWEDLASTVDIGGDSHGLR